MRSIVLLVAGAIVGGAGVYLLRLNSAASFDESRPEPQAEQPGTAPATGTGSDLPAVGAMGQFVATRIAAYERALEATDVLDLETLLDIAATAPRSRSRDLEIGVLLERLAELDPVRAVDYAQSSFLDTRFLVQAFTALARVDADAAIARLQSIRPPAKQRSVAIGLLDVLGADTSTIEQIARGLPEGDRHSFELDALIARAELDPFGVLQTTLGSGIPGMQSYLLPRLAELAVAQDPLPALALGEGITDFNQARSYEFAVLRAWAELDPDALFVWLEEAEPSALTAAAPVFPTLARSDPDRLLAMADGLPPSARASAKRAVMQTLAERDPLSALALLDTMPPGQDRESMLQTIGQTYGRQDPETAMAWARSLSPPSQTAVQSVLHGIAAVDVDRAIDLFLTDIVEQNSGSLAGAASAMMVFSLPMMFSELSTNGEAIGRLTDRLLEINDPRSRSMLSSTLASWAARDINAALNWTLANADQLDANALRNVARNLAESNLSLAVSTLEQLPASRRAGWLEGMASQMAQSSTDQARGFLERFRGQPGYDRAVATVAQEMARTDPVAAANMLGDVGSPAALQQASFMIAREWANRDPAAAARWALEDISDSDVQTAAMNTIASTWAQRDSVAAERWLFSLGSGPGRDAAADGFLAAAAQVGRFEPRLLEAYSSDQARQRGVSRAITMMARSDPAGATELMDSYLTDPALRAQTEQQIAQMSARSTALPAGIILGF